MHINRKPAADITPGYEDAGLFRNGTFKVMVSLVPRFRRNGREDVVIAGFVANQRAVNITFAGRRKAAAAPVVARLEAVRNHTIKQAVRDRAPLPEIKDIRVPILVEGAWRKHTVTDADGWETRTYELIAARWAIKDKDGVTMQYGEPSTLDF